MKISKLPKNDNQIVLSIHNQVECNTFKLLCHAPQLHNFLLTYNYSKLHIKKNESCVVMDECLYLWVESHWLRSVRATTFSATTFSTLVRYSKIKK